MPSDVASEFVVDGSYINETPVTDMDDIFYFLPIDSDLVQSARKEDLPQAAEASTSHTDDPSIPLTDDSETLKILEYSLNRGNVEGPSQGIPSPFKRHFFFPEFQVNAAKKKRIVKERMPTIVSGKICLQYFENKKKNLERLKIERAIQRQRKKEENERMMQNKAQQLKKKKKKGFQPFLQIAPIQVSKFPLEKVCFQSPRKMRPPLITLGNPC